MSEDLRVSDSAKRAIGVAIEDHLIAIGMARGQLVRHDLSEDKIQRALHGDFTRRTLVKIETILGRSFHEEKREAGIALDMLGAYSKSSVEHLIGDYVLIRPAFTNPSKINAYKLTVEWNCEKGGLFFQEKERVDSTYTQNGYVLIPPAKPFIYFSTLANGSVRNIVLNYFDTQGFARGVISTIYNPRGPHFLPICAPVVIFKSNKIEDSDIGILDSSHDKYEEYSRLISSVGSDEYCMMITGNNQIERRKGLAVVA